MHYKEIYLAVVMRYRISQAAHKKLARDTSKAHQSEESNEGERRISFTNSVELADNLSKRLESLEKIILTLAHG